MAGAIVNPKVIDDKFKAMTGILQKISPQLQDALPDNVTVQRFIRLALNAALVNPALVTADQRSFVRSVLQCAALGLEPNSPLGEAHLIVYKNKYKDAQGNTVTVPEVTFQPGYKGLEKLVLNSGKIKRLVPRVVFDKDEFKYILGMNEDLIHTPAPGPDRGKLKYAYCIVYFENGDKTFEVMDAHDIEKVKSKSKTVSYDNSPWRLHEEEMWIKSIIIRTSKRLQRSPQLARAVSIDAKVEGRERPHYDPEIEMAIPVDTELIPIEENPEEQQGQTENGKPAGNKGDQMLKKLKPEEKPAPTEEKKPEPEEIPGPEEIPEPEAESEPDDEGFEEEATDDMLTVIKDGLKERKFGAGDVKVKKVIEDYLAGPKHSRDDGVKYMAWLDAMPRK